jgi:hypothetical protein
MVALSTIISCKKSNTARESFYDNFVELSQIQYTDNGLDTVLGVSVGAGFTNPVTHEGVRMASVEINHRSITPNFDRLFDFNYTDSPSTLSEGLALAGTLVHVKVTGVSLADTAAQDVYMPATLARQTGVFPVTNANGGIDAKKPLVLNWTPDPNTSAQLITTIELFEIEDANQRIGTIGTKTYTVPDKGTFTIPPADLSVYPDGSVIELSLIRYHNQTAVLPISKRRINFAIYSELESAQLPVSNQ